MYLLYSALLVAWGILSAPVYLYRAWRRHKPLPGLAQRLGRLPDSLRHDGRATIWFHSCSVGETLSVGPLAQFLHRRFPEARFVFSTVTKTGQIVAMQRFAAYGEGNTFYFPIDLASIAGHVLDWIRPDILVFIDTEIWPNILRQAHRRGIPIVLANGRISTASFRYYRWAKPFLAGVLRNYRVLMMQSEEDARRIAEMGAPPEKIVVTANIKFDRDLVEKESDALSARDLEKVFGLNDAEGPLVVAGSTHHGEEQILLEVFRRIRRIPALDRTRLLLAPRHPERFDAVARLADLSGFHVQRRTAGNASGRHAEVLLLDTLGELAAVYRFATIVFVGGSLTGHGGHSIMEPALYSKAIVTGPSMQSFRAIFDEFHTNGGIRQISAGEKDRELQIEQLLDVFVHLLQNTQEREALGRSAFSILERNRGAARRTGESIASIFGEKMIPSAGRALRTM